MNGQVIFRAKRPLFSANYSELPSLSKPAYEWTSGGGDSSQAQHLEDKGVF